MTRYLLLFAFVGKLVWFENGQPVNECVATLVAPKVLLTAKHCLPLENEKLSSKTEAKFFLNGVEIAPIVNSLHMEGNWDSTFHLDWALAELASAPRFIDDRTKFPPVFPTSELKSVRVTIGHTQNKNLLGMSRDKMFYVDEKFAPGSSGSPVFGTTRDGNLGIVGILTRASEGPKWFIESSNNQRRLFEHFSYGVSAELFLDKLTSAIAQP